MDERAPQPHPRAAAARAARRGQINALRTRVAVLAVSVFIAAWGVVFVRLVEGHDPALASTSGAVITQSADPDVTEDDGITSASSSSSSGSSPSAAAGGDGAVADPAPVTTRQS